MQTINIVKQSDISQQQLDEIISIKSIAWPYSYEKQVEWINKHLNDNDLHFLLFNSGILEGYINLFPVEVAINQKETKAFGVGNVCVKNKGKGLGLQLMKQANNFISKTGKPGLLFCKPQLTNFYLKSGWLLTDKSTVIIDSEYPNVQTMIYNYSSPVYQFKYAGKLF
jgi:predicted N-acetyltransferase YhbS